MLDRRPHARLRGQVDDLVDAVLLDQALDEPLLADVAFDELEADEAAEVREVAPLDGGIVVRVEVVQPDDAAAPRRQALDDMGTDETRRAGDQDRAQSFTTFAGLPSALVAFRVSTTSFAVFTTCA